MNSHENLSTRSFEDLLSQVLLADGPAADAFREHVVRLTGEVQAALVAAEFDRMRAAGDAAGTADTDEGDEMGQAIAELFRRLMHAGRRRPAGPEPDASTGPEPRGGRNAVREPDTGIGSGRESTEDSTLPLAMTTPADPAMDRNAPADGTTATGQDRQGAHPPHGGVRPHVIDDVQALFVEFASAPEVRAWLGEEPVPYDDFMVRWRGFHLSLLRLPVVVADAWSSRVRSVVPVRWMTPTEDWERIATDADEQILLPACGNQGGVLATPTVEASGRILEALGKEWLDHRHVAALAHQVLWVAGRDSAAYSARTTQLMPLQVSDEFSDYVGNLCEKLTAYAEAVTWGKGGEHCVLRAAQLAEALRCVVHRPLAAEDSWWGRLRRQASQFVDLVRWNYAPTVEVRLVNGRYAEASKLSLSDRLQDVRLQVPSNGQDGMVLDCLRPFLRGDQIGDRPGRVIYGARS